MPIQSKNYSKDESISRNLVNEVREEHFSFPNAAYPEDIPLIEAYDEQSLRDMYPSDGVYQIEDL